MYEYNLLGPFSDVFTYMISGLTTWHWLISYLPIAHCLDLGPHKFFPFGVGMHVGVVLVQVLFK